MRCFFLRLYARLFIRRICVKHAEETYWHHSEQTGWHYGCSGCIAERDRKEEIATARKEAKKAARWQRRANVLKALRKCKGE